MTATEAAEVIGCTAPHVRYLIRNNVIRGAVRLESYPGAWYYDIPAEEARRVRDEGLVRHRRRKS